MFVATAGMPRETTIMFAVATGMFRETTITFVVATGMFRETTIMFVVATGMFPGNHHNVRGDYRNVPLPRPIAGNIRLPGAAASVHFASAFATTVIGALASRAWIIFQNTSFVRRVLASRCSSSFFWDPSAAAAAATASPTSCPTTFPIDIADRGAL